MPDISQMIESKYLKKADVETAPMTVTIVSCIEENVALEDKPVELLWVARFQGQKKGLILKKTNLGLMALATGQRNSDNWPGCTVTLFNDPTVQFKGELCGGLRVMVPRPEMQQAPPPSQFTPGNNLAPQNPPRTDETGPLPTEPDLRLPGDAIQ
jgi:hypothetical protein